MSINLQFDEDRREAIEQAWAEWWAGELERPIVIIASGPPIVQADPREFTREFISETPIDEVLDFYQPRLENIRYSADALPTFFPSWVGEIGKRSKVDPETLTVWGDVGEPIPFENIHPAYDPNHVRSRGMQFRARAVERWGGKVTISHGGLMVGLHSLMSSRTPSQLLLDLYEAPDEVIRASKELTDVAIRHYDESYDIINIKKGNRGTTDWLPLWSPERYHMYQCDFIAMISPEMFERFVMSDLDRCFRRTNHAFYHLDGPGAIRHLDMLLSLESLRGVQWNPAPQKPRASDWIPLLKRIKDGGKLCLVSVDPDGARQIVREIGGRGVCLITHSPPEEVDDFLAVLAAEDADAI